MWWAQGNVLGGYYLLSLPDEAGHASVAWNALPDAVETALEALTGVGDVTVSRSAPDLQVRAA
jgi:hypothetical protein